MKRGLRPRPLALALVTLASLCLGNLVLAQGETWSIQTVALRDLREAQLRAAELRSAGFPAFTEFTMSDGLQYVRVRVGCWSSRDAALGVAELLLGGHAREAVVVPHSEASPEPCVEVDVGFLTPSTWAPLHDVGEAPTFRVELAGHVGHIRHDGLRWSVLQGDTSPAPIDAIALPMRFGTGELGGGPLVFVERGGDLVVLCPGRLIGHVEDVVIVEWSDAVVACRTQTEPEPGTP